MENVPSESGMEEIALQTPRGEPQNQGTGNRIASVQSPPPRQFSGTPKKSDKEWKAYELAWTETPVLCCLAPVLAFWIRFRQFILRNPVFSARIPFPCYKAWNRAFTVGELVVYGAVCGILIAYCVLCFVGSKCDEEGSGSVANMVAVLTFALASRNSIFTLALGIPFERALFWHKLMAIVTVVLSWVHGVRIIQEGEDGEDEALSGYVYAGIMSAMLIFSIVWLRRYFFNGFHLIHIILAIATAVSAMAHGAGGVLFGVAVWGVDVVLRYFILAGLKNPHKATVTRLPANVVRISFPKEKVDYSPGQYFFVMIPKVNVFEWHPFSISSSPHQDLVTIHIRVLGNWTKSLHQVCTENGGPAEMSVYLDGPYGSPEIDIDGDKYKMFLLISGGIGITPLQSICNHLIHEHEQTGRPMKKIWFVWSCADKYMISASFEHDQDWAVPVLNSTKTSRLPISFQPDNLERLNSGTMKGPKEENPAMQTDVLHTEFYLTRVRNEAEFDKGNIWPHMQDYLKFGRPDIPEIFKQMREMAIEAGEGRVAVLSCGPTGMIDTVRGLSSQFSSCGGPSFDFHGEVFEF